MTAEPIIGLIPWELGEVFLFRGNLWLDLITSTDPGATVRILNLLTLQTCDISSPQRIIKNRFTLGESFPPLVEPNPYQPLRNKLFRTILPGVEIHRFGGLFKAVVLKRRSESWLQVFVNKTWA